MSSVNIWLFLELWDIVYLLVTSEYVFVAVLNIIQRRLTWVEHVTGMSRAEKSKQGFVRDLRLPTAV